jgi:hypothetical protein
MAPPKMGCVAPPESTSNDRVVERGDMKMRIKTEMVIKMKIKIEEKSRNNHQQKLQVDVHRVLLVSRK